MLPLARPVAAQKRIAATRLFCDEVSRLSSEDPMIYMLTIWNLG